MGCLEDFANAMTATKKSLENVIEEIKKENASSNSDQQDTIDKFIKSKSTSLFARADSKFVKGSQNAKEKAILVNKAFGVLKDKNSSEIARKESLDFIVKNTGKDGETLEREMREKNEKRDKKINEKIDRAFVG